MADFVLVAGAWHGAWTWRRVLPRLWQEGHRAFTVPLALLWPGRSPVGMRTVPVCLNTIQHPLPSPLRCFKEFDVCRFPRVSMSRPGTPTGPWSSISGASGSSAAPRA